MHFQAWKEFSNFMSQCSLTCGFLGFEQVKPAWSERSCLVPASTWSALCGRGWSLGPTCMVSDPCARPIRGRAVNSPTAWSRVQLSPDVQLASACLLGVLAELGTRPSPSQGEEGRRGTTLPPFSCPSSAWCRKEPVSGCAFVPRPLMSLPALLRSPGGQCGLKYPGGCFVTPSKPPALPVGPVCFLFCS